MGKPKAPKPPNPNTVAGAQTGTNVATSVANAQIQNMNQVTPTGSLTFGQQTNPDGSPKTYKYTDPNSGKVFDIPLMQSTTTLSPGQQKIFDANEGTQQNMAGLARDASGRLGAHLGTGMDVSGLAAGGNPDDVRRANFRTNYQETLGNVGNINRNFDGTIADAGAITKTYGTDWSQDRQRVEDAIMSRMNPSLDRDREALRSSLLGQGIREGSTAFDRAMNRSGEQANDARMQAILAGGQEQSRLAGLDMSRAMFQNSAQGQQFGQNDAIRSARNQALGMGNEAQGQMFGQEVTRGEFRNNAIDRYNNAVMGQQQADMGYQDFRTNQRQAGLGEMFSLRNQPINEIAALTSGSQIGMPSFGNYGGSPMPTVDIAGLTNSNYGQRLDAYNNRQSTIGSVFGTLGGVAGAALGGPMGATLGAGLFGGRR